MVFHVIDAQAGDAYLLRLHSPLTAAFEGERLRPKGIASELCWLEALSDETSFVLQRPVRSKEGDLVTMLAGEQGDIPCSLLQWIEQKTLKMILTTLAEAQEPLMLIHADSGAVIFLPLKPMSTLLISPSVALGHHSLIWARVFLA